MFVRKNLIGLGALLASALLVAGPATAARIQTVRDVSAREAHTLPATSIQVVRDVGARPAVPRRPHVTITVVRDTPARDAARGSRRGAAALRYFWANEYSLT